MPGRRSPRVLAVALLAAGAATAVAATPAPEVPPPQPYLLAVIPQAPPVAMHRRWAPFVDRLSALSGVPLRLLLYEDMKGFEAAYAAGVPDLLFAHPSMSVAAHRQQGYVPLVRDRNEIAGVIFVKKDSPIRSVRELGGKQVAFVGARSFCSILSRHAMAQAQIDLHFESQVQGSTRNVLKAVVLGKAEAGASLDVALSEEPTDLQAEVRPILTTAKVPPHPISAHPRTPEAVRAALTAAVLRMAATPADRALLEAVRMPDPVAADYDRDYRRLEQVQ